MNGSLGTMLVGVLVTLLVVLGAGFMIVSAVSGLADDLREQVNQEQTVQTASR